MQILHIGFARTYYAKILEIHYNHGTQTKEQKVIEYKDILDKVMTNAVTRYKDGYDFIFSERRSDKNQKGTVSAILASCISLVIATRNEIEHNKVTIDYLLYKLCVKTLAETINFFSDEPIISEIVEIYDTDNFIQLPKNSTHQTNINVTAKKLGYQTEEIKDTRPRGNIKKNEFKTWIEENERLSAGAVSSYSNAIDKISQHYSNEKGIAIDLYSEHDLNRIKQIAAEYRTDGSFEVFGKENHGLCSAAIKKYVEFLGGNIK